jgi:type I restriction enzyme M protein
VQLIDATGLFLKMKKSLGNKRNKIGGTEEGEPDHIGEITRIYGEFADAGNCKIFDNRKFGYLKMTVERPLRLNFVVNEERIERVKQSSYFVGLAESKKRKTGEAKTKEIEEGKKQQEQILAVLEKIRNHGIHGTHGTDLIKDRAVFEKVLEKGFQGSEIKLDAALKKALLAPGALGEKDPTAEICKDSKGKPEPDADLRDTENVEMPEGIALPLPLDYESKQNKGKVDKSKLLKLVKGHGEEYLNREVLPYRPDAWIDHSKIKVGYEIPFTRHFYKYQPPRPLNEIADDIKGLETEIVRMLAEVTA